MPYSVTRKSFFNLILIKFSFSSTLTCQKQKRISADQALQNILQFVYEDSDEEESDMDELYAEEDFENNDCNDIDAEQSPTRMFPQMMKLLKHRLK